jgi:hypothetical protein
MDVYFSRKLGLIGRRAGWTWHGTPLSLRIREPGKFVCSKLNTRVFNLTPSSQTFPQENVSADALRLIVQDHAEKRIMHFQSVAVVFDEAPLSESIHKEVHA